MLNLLDEFCCIVSASFSINIPLMKNIKSFSVVSVNPVGADAVTAVNLDVELLTKLPV